MPDEIEMLESRPHVRIAGRDIGEGYPPYVVAEISANHNGKRARALRLMEQAKRSGADAVKLQTYTAKTLTLDAEGADFLIRDGLWKGRRLYDLYEEAHTPWDWHEELFAKGRELGITVFSTPFDPSAVDFLEELGAPAYKIASFEIIDLPLIEHVASTGKPIIMSTGIATLSEIEEAVAAARRAGCRELVLLHCVSGYPTPVEECNLRTIPHLADTFDVVTGLSDHTLGTSVSIAAVAIGAAVIEKHVTLRRADGGPDAAFSLEPEELEELCNGCRSTATALGRIDYQLKESERQSRVFRRSLYVVEDIKEGESFSARNVKSIRPGSGLSPKHLPKICGRQATKHIARGTPLSWSMVDFGNE